MADSLYEQMQNNQKFQARNNKRLNQGLIKTMDQSRQSGFVEIYGKGENSFEVVVTSEGILISKQGSKIAEATCLEYKVDMVEPNIIINIETQREYNAVNTALYYACSAYYVEYTGEGYELKDNLDEDAPYQSICFQDMNNKISSKYPVYKVHEPVNKTDKINAEFLQENKGYLESTIVDMLNDIKDVSTIYALDHFWDVQLHVNQGKSFLNIFVKDSNDLIISINKTNRTIEISELKKPVDKVLLDTVKRVLLIK